MENLRYKKISAFLQDLKNREKKYKLKKLQKDILQDVFNVDFTVNGQKIKYSVKPSLLLYKFIIKWRYKKWD